MRKPPAISSQPSAVSKGRRGTPHFGAAMSFEEIGRELGITRGGAWMAYQSAMRKLRRKCHARQLERMRELATVKMIGENQ
jgi:DNA-directed RNA polymerase sigma subunit (sigma70/sigma32)